MATNYGKILRKLRIDMDELLKEMAQKVDVSSAFLSAVENGTKAPSERLTESIIRIYALSSESANQLRAAAKDDVYSPTLQISLRGKAAENKGLALSFARKFDSLSSEDIDYIQRILNKEGTV